MIVHWVMLSYKMVIPICKTESKSLKNNSGHQGKICMLFRSCIRGSKSFRCVKDEFLFVFFLRMKGSERNCHSLCCQRKRGLETMSDVMFLEKMLESGRLDFPLFRLFLNESVHFALSCLSLYILTFKSCLQSLVQIPSLLYCTLITCSVCFLGSFHIRFFFLSLSQNQIVSHMRSTAKWSHS